MRSDDTWRRLLEWTYGQADSERLAYQLLRSEGYHRMDPSHPLGGRDGGRDGIAWRAGRLWSWASYFPRGEQSFSKIKAKFVSDLENARLGATDGFAFVTNQELLLSQRRALLDRAHPTVTDIFHLERITCILDSPGMAPIRKEFLNLPESPTIAVSDVVVDTGSLIISQGQLGGQVAHQIINVGSQPRTLSRPATDALVSELRRELPEAFRIDYVAGNFESQQLAQQLKQLLQEAGWHLVAEGSQQHLTSTTPRGLHLYVSKPRHAPGLLRDRLMQAGLAPSMTGEELAIGYFSRRRPPGLSGDFTGIVVGVDIPRSRCPFCGNIATFDGGYCNQCGEHNEVT